MIHNNKGVNSERTHINLNMHEPKKNVSKYTRQKLIELKGKINKSAITVRGFNYSSVNS